MYAGLVGEVPELPAEALSPGTYARPPARAELRA